MAMLCDIYLFGNLYNVQDSVLSREAKKQKNPVFGFISLEEKSTVMWDLRRAKLLILSSFACNERQWPEQRMTMEP